ncbi:MULTISPECIES: hypothetical protein [Mesorhizobium]|uniref:hypothetical protein n=1 Tax=Mesorhizobium TaxID=68287 RepID=UPI000800D841|nr:MULTISPECIES: hypothetical protein [Mesorhizobium]
MTDFDFGAAVRWSRFDSQKPLSRGPEMELPIIGNLVGPEVAGEGGNDSGHLPQSPYPDASFIHAGRSKTCGSLIPFQKLNARRPVWTGRPRHNLGGI